jgi:hypothetical protein
MLIIDNFVYSFAFHLENGIPMVPFFGDKEDNEMIKLIKYIQGISDKDDLRATNTSIFQLHKIYNTDIANFIEYYGFDNLVDKSSSSSDNSSNGDEEIKIESPQAASTHANVDGGSDSFFSPF